MGKIINIIKKAKEIISKITGIIFKQTTPETDAKDFKLAKRIVEVILFLIAAIQLFQEFSSSRYFDQVLIILSLSGMTVYMVGAVKKLGQAIEILETDGYTVMRDMMDFHNTFIASIFIPMIFIFSADKGIFTGTSLWDLNSMKKIILTVALFSVFYYRILVSLVQRYCENIKADDEFEYSHKGIRYYKWLIWLIFISVIIDLGLCVLNIWLSESMEWKNAYFYNVTAEIYLFVALCVIVLFFVNDKKRIILAIAVLLTVSEIGYSSYMQFSRERTYDFGVADFTEFYIFDKEDKTYVDITCRFEKDKDGKGVYKYCMMLFKDYGDEFKIIEEAVSYGNYEAFEYKNSFSQWQDRDSDTYYRKKNLDKGERPVSFRITNEVVKCKEDGELKELIDNAEYLKMNFDDEETEPVIIGDSYIEFRGNDLERVDELSEYLDNKLDGLEVKGE